MKRTFTGFALTCGLLAMAASAQAGYIEYSTDFSANNARVQTYTSGSGLSGTNATVATTNLSRFDSGLGTLTGVEISFTSEWNHSTYATARDTSSEYTVRSYTYSYSCGWGRTCYGTSYYRDYRNDTWVHANAYNSLSLSLIDPAAVTNSLLDTNYVSCSRYSNGTSYLYCNDTDATSGTFDDLLDLSGFDLSQFVTSDALLNPLVFQMRNNTSVRGSCDNNDNGDYCTARTISDWGGTITVGYTYDEVTSVPEPEGLLLLSIGLLGLLGASKKRRA
jgi:hypothetical protein